MGKLYHTHEVKDVFDEKLNGMILEAANDSELTGSVLGSVIEKIRLFRKFADEIIAYMEKEDEKYEAEMAEWRAKNGTST